MLSDSLNNIKHKTLLSKSFVTTVLNVYNITEEQHTSCQLVLNVKDNLPTCPG